jgi:hypothetical protein
MWMRLRKLPDETKTSETTRALRVEHDQSDTRFNGHNTSVTSERGGLLSALPSIAEGLVKESTGTTPYIDRILFRGFQG